MKEIRRETFLRAFNSPLATVQEVQYGNSFFGNFTTLVYVDGLHFLCETRVYHNVLGTEIEGDFFQFDNEVESKEYFDDAVEYAEEYSANNGTCAGRF